MVAGAWFLLNDNVPDPFEAEIFLSAFDFPCFDNSDTEEEKCIDSVLSLIPKEWNTTMTIGEAINKMIHNLDDTIKPILEQIGIGYSKKKNAIHFKTNNIVLSSILREKNSPFFATYIEELSRLKGSMRNEGHNYSGRVCKGVYVPIEALNIKKNEEALQW
jgi:hypothetical protein